MVLTFDVEQDCGSLGHPDRYGAVGPFLRWLAGTASRHDWRTTLFVQGSIVEQFAVPLRELQVQHELGLHGYFHELWGGPLWFGQPEVTPPDRRPALLQAGLDAFENAGLRRPRSFRAPNLLADDATLALIAKNGFALDSSAPAFRGCAPIVTKEGPLVRIPVSASPLPNIHRRFGLPTWAYFNLLNVPTFLFLPDERLIEVLSCILAVQRRLKAPQHLVVLAHPWEFADLPLPGCSVSNYERFIQRVEFVQNHLRVQMTTLSSVAGLAQNRTGA